MSRATHLNGQLPSCHCGASWSGHSRCHCSSCHRTFVAITAFDRHRISFTCVDPATRGLVFRDGLWGKPAMPQGTFPARTQGPEPPPVDSAEDSL